MILGGYVYVLWDMYSKLPRFHPCDSTLVSELWGTLQLHLHPAVLVNWNILESRL